MNRSVSGCFGMTGFLMALLFGGSMVSSGYAGTIDPALRAKLDRMSRTDTVRVIVEMAEQANLGTGDRVARLRALRETAARSQASVIDYLAKEQRAGKVTAYHSFRVMNALSLTATKDVIEAVAAQPGVRLVREDRVAHIMPTSTKVKP